VIDFGVVPDDREAVRRVMQEAVGAADCVVSSGGVSVGEADFMREVLEALGSVTFWRVAIKPGKPLAVGLVDGRPYFGLPGNPASVFVTGCMLLAPWLRVAQGRLEADTLPLAMPAVADFEISEAGSREEYLRVVVSSEGRELVARLAGAQSSGVLSSVSRANALLRLPAGALLKPGEHCTVYWLDQLLF
jgi:molybdopterin molybdotransferase